MIFKSLDEMAEFVEEQMLFPTGMEHAVVGAVDMFGSPQTVALIDKDAVIEHLVNVDGMSPDEAEEHFDFNVAGAHLGEATPAYLVHSIEKPAPTVEQLIRDKTVTITSVIDEVIMINGIVGVGLISLGDDLKKYCYDKIPPATDAERMG